MSTVYYTNDDRPIGQIHAKAKGQGTHFTWAMLPLTYIEYREECSHSLTAVQSGAAALSINIFECMVGRCTSQSYDERLAEV